jgi:hypothetical protein
MKKTREELRFKPKYYPGEIGELYKVSFVPTYMENWSNLKIKIVCFILNRLPLKIVTWIENHIL